MKARTKLKSLTALVFLVHRVGDRSPGRLSWSLRSRMPRLRCASPCWRRRVRSFVLCGSLALSRTRLLHIAEVYQAKDEAVCGGSDTLTTSCPTVPRAPVIAIFMLLIRGAVDWVVFDLVMNLNRFPKDCKCDETL